MATPPQADFIAEELGWKLLITSRFNGMIHGDCREFQIGRLSESAAIELLVQAGQVQRSPQVENVAAEMAKLCG
jgi:hypothetical protein